MPPGGMQTPRAGQERQWLDNRRTTVMSCGAEICRPLRRWGLRLLLASWLLGQSLAMGQPVASRPARVVTEYALTSGGTWEFADPHNWRLLGSNDDGRTWDLLDVRTNQSFKSRCQRRVFAVVNRTAYNTYRLQVDNTEEVQLAELELMGAVAGRRAKRTCKPPSRPRKSIPCWDRRLRPLTAIRTLGGCAGGRG
jgi:hypothetical protein